MAPPKHGVMQDLRLRYNAAHAAYQACARAVTEATMSGEIPSTTLLEQEAEARRALAKTRANLLAAMANDAPGAEPAAQTLDRAGAHDATAT